MPIYVYKTTEKGCSHCREGFEVLQAMSAKPLKQCPECGGPVRKCPARVGGGVPMMSNGNLRDKGFTKLERRGDGTYEKTT